MDTKCDKCGHLTAVVLADRLKEVRDAYIVPKQKSLLDEVLRGASEPGGKTDASPFCPVGATLKLRGKTHGDFRTQATLHGRLLASINYSSAYIHPMYASALNMILLKVSRIVVGDPTEPDHWLDIEGYANLVSKDLAGRGDSEGGYDPNK